MSKHNIICGKHYSATHLNPVYNNGDCVKPFRYNSEFLCPLSTKEEKQTVSIPFHENLTDEQIKFVITKIKENI